jgi:hypothetical protein
VLVLHQARGLHKVRLKPLQPLNRRYYAKRKIEIYDEKRRYLQQFSSAEAASEPKLLYGYDRIVRSVDEIDMKLRITEVKTDRLCGLDHLPHNTFEHYGTSEGRGLDHQLNHCCSHSIRYFKSADLVV